MCNISIEIETIQIQSDPNSNPLKPMINKKMNETRKKATDRTGKRQI